MRTRVPHYLAASLLLSGLAAACGSGGPIGDTPSGSLVLGIQSKLVPGTTIDAVRVVVKANDEVVVDESYKASSGELKFPTEIALSELDEGTEIEATVTGFVGDFPALERLASTEIVGDEKNLLEVELEASCMQAVGGSGPSCKAPQTCLHGTCQGSHVAGTALPAYDPDWAKTTTDTCKPKGAGDPIVVVGEGQADYLPMEDGALAQVEAGPQGGHHVWVAVRLKNLTQSGSITSLTGHFPDLDLDVGPFNVIFTFDPDEGGYCELHGLRFQLDSEQDIQQMLGQTLEISASIKDKDGDVGIGTKAVTLSSTILGS